MLVIASLLLTVQSPSSTPGWVWKNPPRAASWHDEPTSTSGFGHRILTLADLDEDGVQDLAIGAPSDAVRGGRPGRLFLVSGRTGSLLSQRPLVIELQRPTPVHVQDLDLDGDGVGERFTPLPDDGPLIALSSRSGERLFTMHHDDPGGYLEDFGASVAPAGDLDRDGVVDVAVGCSEYGFDAGDAYAVELFSGRDGHLLLAIDTDRKSVTVASAFDFNGDGCLDLPVGLPEDEIVFVLDGKALRANLDSSRRIPIPGSVLLTIRRGSYPSGSPTDPFPVLPSPSAGR